MKRVAKKAAKVGAMIGLSKCAMRFALAICDPFNPLARGACIPRHPSEPSQKVHGFIRTSVAIGTGGYGFIAFNPSPWNDVVQIWHSTSSWASTDGAIKILSANNALVTGITAGYNSNLPYTLAQGVNSGYIVETGNSPVGARVVAAGIRIQYSGTTLNTSGMSYCLVEPQHQSISGMTQAILGTYAECDIAPNSRKPCYLTTFPIAEVDFLYTNNGSYPNNETATSVAYPGYASAGDSFIAAADVPSGPSYTFEDPTHSYTYNWCPPIAGIIFAGVAGETVHLEYIIHAEYSGQLSANMATPNFTDPTGLNQVISAASQLGAKMLAEPNRSRWSLLRDGLVDGVRMAAPIAIPAVESALHALLL